MDKRLKFGFVASSSFLVFGFSMVITGSALPAIVSVFSMTYSQAGLLLSLPTFGFIAGAFLCILLVSRTGPFRLLSVALLLVALSLAWISASRFFWMLVLASVAMSIGAGLIETTVGVGVSSVKYKRTGGALNFIHSAYAVGAIVSPFVVALLLTTPERWWLPFGIASFFCVIVFAYSLSMKDKATAVSATSYSKDFRYLFGERVFWMAIIGVFVYVGYEVAFTSWLSVYAHDVKGVTIRTASIFPALLWTGLFVGRLISGTLVEKLGYARSLLLLSLLSSAAVIGVLISRSFLALVAAVIVSGVGFSGVFPTLQAIMIRGLKRSINEAVSIFSISASLGAAFASYAVGAIGDLFGLFWGVLFVLLLILIEVVLAVLLLKGGKRE